MKRALLSRDPTSDQGTFGRWSFEALPSLAWDTVELPARDNAPQYSCIEPMPGEADRTYLCRLDATSKWSPRSDGRLYHVLDVPGRTLIKIHAATWAGDVRKNWHAELLGCIAPGRRRGELKPAEIPMLQRCVLESRGALREIMDWLSGEAFELVIAWRTA